MTDIIKFFIDNWYIVGMVFFIMLQVVFMFFERDNLTEMDGLQMLLITPIVAVLWPLFVAYLAFACLRGSSGKP